jgi:integrative and conjugative element protein (TIGR02256 family)
VTRTADVLWIADAVLVEMHALATQHSPLETGGVLVGYVADSQATVVTAMIGPGPKAKHRRLRFRPDYDYQQAQLERHFAQTGGRESYLGDWHTHPEGPCALSWLDKRVLARIASTPTSGIAQPIMIVLASTGAQWRSCAVRLRSFRRGPLRTPELVELHLQRFVGPTV